MKKISFKILVSLLFLISLLCCLLTACGDKGGNDNGVTEQDESRLFKFAEHVGTISNPGIGYTSTDWYHTAVGDTKPHDKQGDIVLFFVDLGPFSAGANADGKDYDLDAQFFAALRATFENCRNNGSTVAVRFRYDENGKDNPEPKTFEQVLKHISQIKDSRVLEDYKDILMFVESGFVGKWGEQHGGKYTSVEYKARLLEAMLDCVPSPVPVTVRTPDIFAKYVGIARNKLAEYAAAEGSDASRVGLYNDGYMGSNTDLGTYADRAIETEWLGKQTLTSYFGGEFSGNIDYAKKYDNYLPENCIPEMYKTHLSYINGNIFQLYKDYKFDKKYDVDGYDNSAYYGQSVFQFIRDHLGYRFVLEESNLPKSCAKGGDLGFSFTVTNKGFANPVKQQKCEILLEKDGEFVTAEVEVDPTKWYSGKTLKTELNLKLPALMEEGRWNVYFKSSVGTNGFPQYNFRSVRFASKDVWNAKLGANYLGYFDITASDDGERLCDNTFGEAGKTLTAAHLYTLGSSVAVDGIASDGEWSERDIIAESGQYKLYAKADEDYLYVMSDIPHNSKAPVFNFHAKKNSGETYWIYKQSSGFIYYNLDKQYGHSRLLINYGDNLCEFKIPLYMLEAGRGTTFSEISVSVQDSGDNWVGKGSVKTGGSYVLETEFNLYNATENVTVKKGSSYEIKLETDAEISKIRWYLDGVEIGSNRSSVAIGNIQKDCVLSAEITTAGGSYKKADIAVIKVK